MAPLALVNYPNTGAEYSRRLYRRPSSIGRLSAIIRRDYIRIVTGPYSVLAAGRPLIVEASASTDSPPPRPPPRPLPPDFAHAPSLFIRAAGAAGRTVTSAPLYMKLHKYIYRGSYTSPARAWRHVAAPAGRPSPPAGRLCGFARHVSGETGLRVLRADAAESGGPWRATAGGTPSPRLGEAER